MNRKILALTLVLVAGCVSPPGPAQPLPNWYPVQKDLAVKEAEHWSATVAMVDSSGLLCYRAYKPWAASGDGLDNYLLSHDVADMPAWHGVLMQAVAWKAATTANNMDGLIYRLARGLAWHFEVTGVEGLLGRSAIPDYRGPRLEWMSTQEQRPTKYWERGQGGAWYRNGLAKNHWNQAVTGCALLLHFRRKNQVIMGARTEALLKRVLLGLVRHLHGGGWRIRDASGGFTEFGDLRPDVAFGPEWPAVGLPNGFNRVLVLNALKAASYYDLDLFNEYERAKAWVPGIRASMVATGLGVRAYGHHKWDKPSFSDMHAFATAASCLMLQEEEDAGVRGGIRDSLQALWRFMRYENNPTFSLAMEQAGLDGHVSAVIRLLRHFPGLEGKQGWHFTGRDTSHYQPIENRPPNTMYWKSNPFRQALSVGPELVRNPRTGAGQVYSAQDYLGAYWQGRYLGVLPAR